MEQRNKIQEGESYRADMPLMIEEGDERLFHQRLLDIGIDIRASSVIFITPAGKTIKVQQIRELRSYLQITGSRGRTIIIYSFHKATIESQNALLKILEESGSKFQFVLQVDSVEGVLPTIRSRCRILTKTMATGTDAISPTPSINYPESDYFNTPLTVTNQEDAEKVLQGMISYFRVQLTHEKSMAVPVIKNLLKLFTSVRRNTVNAQIAVDQAVMSIVKAKRQ